MIQERPICFDCETPIKNLTDAIFTPPWHDDAGYPSAVFHGLCLMRWRERRVAVRRRIERHLNGQCDCGQEGS